MSKIVIKAAYLALGGTDYSANAKNIELQLEGPEVDVTNMGSGGWQEVLQGIKKGTVQLDLLIDADLSGIELAIYAVFNHATANTMTFEIRESNAGVSAANPKFTGTLLITKPLALGLKVGEALAQQVSWPTTGAVARATS